MRVCAVCVAREHIGACACGCEPAGVPWSCDVVSSCRNVAASATHSEWSDLLSLVLRLTNRLGPGAESYIGGYRDGTGAPLRVWHWVDGSNASNINVASQGTPPFPAGQPNLK